MIVHHYNTYLKGGAAIAARRLHDSLVQMGVASKFHYQLGGPSDAPDSSYRSYGRRTYPSTWGERIFDRLSGRRGRRDRILGEMEYYLDDKTEGRELFSHAAHWDRTQPDFGADTPDILHLHWVAGLLDYSTFFGGIPPGIPVVWTLHDMHPFTGGCHYDFGCGRYRQQCGECPQLNRHRSPEDLSRSIWKLKWNAIRNSELHIAADSHWLERCARESSLFSSAKTFCTIHYGLDTATFRPGDQQALRREQSIEPDAFVVCFGAQSSTHPRKGLRELAESIRTLDCETLTVVVFGDGNISESLPPHIRRVELGIVDPPENLARVYPLADLFVIPSLQEAFGQTALEAMACGVPVAGFDTGGIPDMVRPGKTGLLAEVGNPHSLADKIQWMIDHPEERRRMGAQARRMVEQEFSLQAQSGKYVELYRNITGRMKE